VVESAHVRRRNRPPAGHPRHARRRPAAPRARRLARRERRAGAGRVPARPGRSRTASTRRPRRPASKTANTPCSPKTSSTGSATSRRPTAARVEFERGFCPRSPRRRSACSNTPPPCSPPTPSAAGRSCRPTRHEPGSDRRRAVELDSPRRSARPHRLYESIGEMERFLTRSDLERLRDLDLTGGRTRRLADILRRSPFRDGLKALRCGGRYAGEAGRLDAFELVRALETTRLTELSAPARCSRPKTFAPSLPRHAAAN